MVKKKRSKFSWFRKRTKTLKPCKLMKFKQPSSPGSLSYRPKKKWNRCLSKSFKKQSSSCYKKDKHRLKPNGQKPSSRRKQSKSATQIGLYKAALERWKTSMTLRFQRRTRPPSIPGSKAFL